ncbi:12457_t:CDS:2, partial [Funneliformis geosporum]
MNIEMDGSFNFYLLDFNNKEDFEYHDNEADFEYHDNETDFEYHDNDKDEDLDPNRVLEEENEEEEEDALITLPSQHPGSPVCRKCGGKFSTDTGISTFKFKEKQERDDTLVTWIIADQQSFSV